ncbi:hypothetical protein OSB04_020100 [Centaurea solstitialis]|uniref:Uncharacterized protein n=1 Tax=Centaurea solstitialis TaxID=347529 RepID=A0AA38TA09_9ASTR|nr:hypothetical protein OSB04_020100 [Centaurea solstitialis]
MMILKPLIFWLGGKERKKKLVLVVIARDLLIVQASTEASESAFFGYTTTKIKINESVECCICLKDFLNGAVRQQHMTMLKESFYGDVETIIHNEEVDEGISPPSKAVPRGGQAERAIKCQEQPALVAPPDDDGEDDDHDE